MIFCGQCGLQLAPGSSICPRCGAANQPAILSAGSDQPNVMASDDPTVASDARASSNTPLFDGDYPTVISGPSAFPLSPIPNYQPQKLVLRPDGDGGDVDAPTSMYGAHGVHAAQPPISPLPAVNPQEGTPYPYAQYNAGSQSNPGQNWGIGSPASQQPPKRGGRGRIVLLLSILFVLLLVLGGMIVYVTQPDLVKGLFGNNSPTPTATAIATTPSPSPTEQARKLVRQYFDDINNKDYQSAYNLWGSAYHSQQTEADFAAGYANTLKDVVTFGQIVTLSDGTVKVPVTLKATEQTSSGQVVSTYEGHYIVGQENGTLKLLSGTLTKKGQVPT